MADDITEKLAARLEELERGLKKSRLFLFPQNAKTALTGESPHA